MDTRAMFGIAVVISGVALYQASNWWERAYATYVSSRISPDGCIRIDTYEAFRILPSQFHRIPHPDSTVENDLGTQWDAVTFDRAYETATNDFLGETIVFDPAGSFGFTDWGDPKTPGHRVVIDGGFPLVDTTRCSDKGTLAKLEEYYERRREANRASQRNLADSREDVAHLPDVK